MPIGGSLYHLALYGLNINQTGLGILQFPLGEGDLPFGLLVSPTPDPNFLRHELLFGQKTVLLDFGLADKMTLVLNRFSMGFNPHSPIHIVDIPGALTSLETVHDIDGVHPRVFVPELGQPALFEMEFERILFVMGLTIILFFWGWRVVQHYRLVLTPVLKFRGFFVLVEVALRIDNCMSLLEMVRTLPTNPESLMREGFYTDIGWTGLPPLHEFKQPCLRHPSK